MKNVIIVNSSNKKYDQNMVYSLLWIITIPIVVLGLFAGISTHFSIKIIELKCSNYECELDT